jgi:putative endonuclease
MKQSYVYIMASKMYGTLYVGVTSDLVGRVFKHKEGEIDGFTKSYSVNRLVYYEIHSDISSAIKREKQIKKWKSQMEINLIEKENPEWKDLYSDII